MTKVFITGLDDLNVGDELFHPGDEDVNTYRVRELDPGSERCVGLEYKRHTLGDGAPWNRVGMYKIETVLQMYKTHVMYKYDPNQTGDTEDDI